MLRSANILPAIVLAAMAATASAQSVTLTDYASPVRDIKADSKVVSRNMDALKKISGEFAQSYRFATSTFYYKEPNKMRLDSKAGVVSVRYVINGNAKTVKAGAINKRTDITNDPGKRQTALTVGLVTPAWINLLNATYKGDRTINGVKTAVFEARHKQEPKGSYRILYMDPAKKYVVRAEGFYGNGKPKMTTDFLDPKQFNGVWVPTRTKVYNPQGELGAVTDLLNIRVNSGLADSLFVL